MKVQRYNNTKHHQPPRETLRDQSDEHNLFIRWKPVALSLSSRSISSNPGQAQQDIFTSCLRLLLRDATAGRPD